MLFNSWEFIVLLVIASFLYYLPVYGSKRRVWQVLLLLGVSAVFYAWEEPQLLILLIASCLGNAFAVERILAVKTVAQAEGSSNGFEQGRIASKSWLFWAVALNLGFLAFFKYSGFLLSLLPDAWVRTSIQNSFSSIPLPIGISFYTFQSVSMLVDAWRDDLSPSSQKRLASRGRERAVSIADTSFYIMFFPQLVAGPIVKAHEFIDQIGAKKFQDIDWKVVRRCLILGYFLKIFVADNLSEHTVVLTVPNFDMAGSALISLLALLYGYSLQIFADFAGYSLIAIGLGALFGYQLPSNFNFPYLSTSITEFWRRWHISLSTWLRDYLYFPLGGNRKGASRTYFNLFLVMFLGGLWHGAAWKFALWGTLHGLFLALERFTNTRKVKQELGQMHESRSWFMKVAVPMLSWVITFHIVTFLWLTFMMPDLSSVQEFFKALMKVNPGFSPPAVFAFLFYGSVIVIYHTWGWLKEHRQKLAIQIQGSIMEPLIHGLMVFLILTNPGAPRGFIYFQF